MWKIGPENCGSEKGEGLAGESPALPMEGVQIPRGLVELYLHTPKKILYVSGRLSKQIE